MEGLLFLLVSVLFVQLEGSSSSSGSSDSFYSCEVPAYRPGSWEGGRQGVGVLTFQRPRQTAGLRPLNIAKKAGKARKGNPGKIIFYL